MTGLWLVSYLVLWALVFVGAMLVLALAREIETLRGRLETAMEYLRRTDIGVRRTEALEEGVTIVYSGEE